MQLVTIHYRGVGSVTWGNGLAMPMVPAAGSYVRHDNRLWQIDAVVVNGDQVDVYAIEMSASVANELTSAWATWGEPAVVG